MPTRVTSLALLLGATTKGPVRPPGCILNQVQNHFHQFLGLSVVNVGRNGHGSESCGKSLLGTVHRNAQDTLVQAIKSHRAIEVIEVTNENRNSLPNLLVERLKTG